MGWVHWYQPRVETLADRPLATGSGEEEMERHLPGGAIGSWTDLCTQMYSDGALGTPSRGLGQQDLQLSPLAELRQHSKGYWAHSVRMDHVQHLQC